MQRAVPMTILLLTFLSVLLLNTPVWAEHQGTVPIQREGLWYYPFHEDPANGRVVEWYGNGQKKVEGRMKDGRKDGLWTSWHANGQKNAEGTFKDGKEDGPWIEWHKNGQKLAEHNYTEVDFCDNDL